jgi:hypothetical protein
VGSRSWLGAYKVTFHSAADPAFQTEFQLQAPVARRAQDYQRQTCAVTYRTVHVTRGRPLTGLSRRNDAKSSFATTTRPSVRCCRCPKCGSASKANPFSRYIEIFDGKDIFPLRWAPIERRSAPNRHPPLRTKVQTSQRLTQGGRVGSPWTPIHSPPLGHGLHRIPAGPRHRARQRLPPLQRGSTGQTGDLGLTCSPVRAHHERTSARLAAVGDGDVPSRIRRQPAQ